MPPSRLFKASPFNLKYAITAQQERERLALASKNSESEIVNEAESYYGSPEAIL